MADTRSLQSSFKDEMITTRASLTSLLNKLQILIDDALSHQFKGILAPDVDHPAKLVYLALTKKLNDHLSLTSQQQFLANEVNWDIKECVTAYVAAERQALKSSKKTVPFNFDQYYASLSEDKKQFFPALITFYQAILLFTRQCRWDANKLQSSKEAHDYDEAVETLSDTIKNMHVCRFTQPPSEDAFELPLVDSCKTAIDAIWAPYIKEGNRILQSWLAKEREVHSYIMSVGELVNVNSLNVEEYCKALDGVEGKVQHEVDQFKLLKTNWVNELDSLTQQVLYTAYVINKLPQQDWQLLQQGIPGVVALMAEEQRCQELETNVLAGHSSYHLARISYLILLDQDKKQDIDAWIKAYADCVDALIEKMKGLQESCYQQTSTNDPRWTVNLDPVFQALMQWAMKQKSSDVHTVLRQQIEIDITAYCKDKHDLCKKNDALFLQRMQDGMVAIRAMKEMLAKEKEVYYEQANQYYQKTMSQYKRGQQELAIKALYETKNQLLSKSIPSISEAFAKAKKEYADNWKPSAPQPVTTSYLGAALHGAYIASRYVTVPAYYVVTAPVVAVTSVAGLFSRSKPAVPSATSLEVLPAAPQDTTGSSAVSSTTPKST